MVPLYIYKYFLTLDTKLYLNITLAVYFLIRSKIKSSQRIKNCTHICLHSIYKRECLIIQSKWKIMKEIDKRYYTSKN